MTISIVVENSKGFLSGWKISKIIRSNNEITLVGGSRLFGLYKPIKAAVQ